MQIQNFKDKLILILMLLCFSGAYLFAVAYMQINICGQNYFCLQDDSMISMRYAHNLASGSGLVWNPGERVQGYTNPAWTLIMAVLHTIEIPLSRLSLYVQLINGAILAAIICLVFSFLKKRAGLLPAVLSSLLTGFNSSIFLYTVNGFEVTLQTLLLVLAYLPVLPLKNPKLQSSGVQPPSMILSAAAVTVRPDAIVFYVWTCILSLLKFLKDKARAERQKTIICLISSLTILSLLFAFQAFYYGSILPNTYYLKTGRGGDISWWASFYFLGNFVFNPQGILLVCSIAYLMSCAKIKELKEQALSLLALIIIWIAYVWSVGGDTFLYGRFYVVIFPLLSICTSLLLCEQLNRLLQRKGAKETGSSQESGFQLSPLFFGLNSVILLALLINAPFEVKKALKHEKWKNETSILSANAVRRLQIPNSKLIAKFRAGATPYFLWDYKFHDMLGKSEREIARGPIKWGPPGHSKWNIDYSLSQAKPDLLIFATEDLNDDKAKKLLDSREPFGFTPDIWLNKTFKEHYKKAAVVYPEDESRVLKEGNPYLESIFLLDESSKK